MTDWFKHLDGFDEKSKGIWGEKGEVLLKWATIWKNKDGIESQLEARYKSLSVGQRKGLKKPIRRFVEEADEFMDQVGNGSFFGTKEEYKKETIKNLATLWFKACNAYYKRKDGAVSVKRADKDKSIFEVIAFGPWLFWSEEDWEEIVYKYNKWKRLQKRGQLSTTEVINMDSLISPSQQRRGRRAPAQQENRDRSRSRERNTSNLNRNHNRNHNHNHNKRDKHNNNTNSSTNSGQAPDEIQSDASLV